jgi:ABC-type Fe3+ transport system substrate-binding protein
MSCTPWRLAADIDAQRKAGKLEADLAILQTIQDFERWRKTGALLPFKPDGFNLIPASFKDRSKIPGQAHQHLPAR